MYSKVLLVVLLSLSLAAFAQVSAPPMSNNASSLAITSLPAGYGSSGQAGGVVLSTPNASFSPTPTTAGISNEGRAGISNSGAFNSGVQPVPPGSYVYMPSSETPAETPATEAPTPASGNNLLPSYFVNNVGTPANASGPSLAEIAARYGRGRGTAVGKNARTYTNADVPHENAGLLTPVLLAEGRLPPDAQQPGTLMASASPAQQPSSAPPAAQPQTQAATQPANPHGELPASASPLPLLGLLGLASGGLGLWFRRRR